MRSAEIQGEPGQSVRELARRLGVRRTRFRPLLPLGRAKDWPEPPTSEALGAHADPMDLIENRFRPVSSCGLGQNLYVEPSGESFACYAAGRGGKAREGDGDSERDALIQSACRCQAPLASQWRKIAGE